MFSITLASLAKEAELKLAAIVSGFIWASHVKMLATAGPWRSPHQLQTSSQCRVPAANRTQRLRGNYLVFMSSTEGMSQVERKGKQ
jgi:hypothetical protein